VILWISFEDAQKLGAALAQAAQSVRDEYGLRKIVAKEPEAFLWAGADALAGLLGVPIAVGEPSAVCKPPLFLDRKKDAT
jgi:hypothetical protein